MDIDFSPFDIDDVAKIALQRTAHLKRYPFLGCPSYTAWIKGNWGPLLREAQKRRKIILDGTMQDIAREFAVIEAHIGDRKIDAMMDIGCGHALIDLLCWRRYGCAIHLVDIEESETAHHDYHNSGSGYASLAAATRFLVANGVPDAMITTTNPKKDTLVAHDLDLIISMISAGFHYPISTYTNFALGALKPGGSLIFDARSGTDQEKMLTGFDPVIDIAQGTKHRKLAAYRPSV